MPEPSEQETSRDNRCPIIFPVVPGQRKMNGHRFHGLISSPRRGSHETALITGMTEEEQGNDPDSIARWIAEFEAIPPLLMTPEEEAEWQAARKAQRQFELATSDERAEKLRRMWE